jgi:phosphate starvation-inducible PhoH-like protein
MTRQNNNRKRPPKPDQAPWGEPKEPTGKLRPTRLASTAFSPRNPYQAEAKAILAAHPVTFLVGPAGTAKTTLAAAQAVDDLLAGRAKTLMLTRANVEAGEPIGALPGTQREKMEIWCRAMLDALGLFLGKTQVKTMLDQGLIELMPSGLLRGQSLNDITVIVDEYQNLTPKQGKLVLTRIGENARFIMTCDPEQCDLPENKPSACEDMERFEGEPGIAFVDFDEEDVTRSEACRTIIRCYAKR